jgi:hypothetical protein
MELFKEVGARKILDRFPRIAVGAIAFPPQMAVKPSASKLRIQNLFNLEVILVCLNLDRAFS